MKTFEQFVNEGIDIKPSSYLYKVDPSGIKHDEVQTDNDKILREKIKQSVKSGEIDVNDIKFEFLKKDHMFHFKIIFPKSLENFLTKNNVDLDTLRNVNISKFSDKPIPRLVELESLGHRTHFPMGIPVYLRNTGFGYSIYKQFFKYIGWARSAGDASALIRYVWQKIAKDSNFYTITTRNQILVINKNIVGIPYPIGGVTLDEWVKTIGRTYTDKNVLEIISKFFRINDVDSIEKTELDPELLNKYPSIKHDLERYINYGKKTASDKIEPNDLLNFKLKNGKEIDCIVVNEMDNGDFEMSDENGWERYSYYYDKKYNYLIYKIASDNNGFLHGGWDPKKWSKKNYHWVESIKSFKIKAKNFKNIQTKK